LGKLEGNHGLFFRFLKLFVKRTKEIGGNADADDEDNILKWSVFWSILVRDDYVAMYIRAKLESNRLRG